MEVSLWWQALAKMDKDYTAFIRLTDADGRVLASEDRVMLLGDLPTSFWPLGLVVKNEYGLLLPADATPGDYTITVGIYSWETGERLPVWDERGRREAGDTLQLATITLSELPDPG